RFVFATDDPERTIGVAAESAVREVVGRNPIQSTLSDRRQQIADSIQEVLQRLVDAYGLGVTITQVQLQRVDPPQAVIEAFNDVQRARADQERARNEAEAYRNDILPRARGEADRIEQEAQGYHAQVVSLAEGDTKGFHAVYEAYRRAPETTAWRLYLDSVDELLRRATRVVVDPSGRGAASLLPYLSVPDLNRAAPPAPASTGAKP
ncbi:MAG: FtsH protease activity modulator HflK, partial [Betaproteobacteria bacterium]|nr:FtsH protease activity modulator HflK [Betaproteobacteria bacterium]